MSQAAVINVMEVRRLGWVTDWWLDVALHRLISWIQTLSGKPEGLHDSEIGTSKLGLRLTIALDTK